MAITLTSLQAAGNPVRSAMLLLDFDAETEIPDTAELTVTAEVLDADGGNVDASAVITTAASGITPLDTYADAFLADLQAALTGAFVWISKNTARQYVFHFEAKHDLAQTVNLSAAGYDPAPV